MGIDAGDNIDVADSSNNRTRKITPDGVVTTVAGDGTAATSNNANPLLAQFSNPTDVAMSSNGSLYIAELGGYKVRKMAAGGAVTTLAGTGTAVSLDGTGTAAGFLAPSNISIDNGDHLLVSDEHSIRRVTEAGLVTTPTGSPGDDGFIDGLIYRSFYYTPHDIAIMANGSALIADYSNNSIRKVTGLAGISARLGKAW